LLQTVYNCQHLLVVSGVILFRRVEGSGMESSRYHRFVIFSLSIITSESPITGIGNENNRFRTFVINRFAEGCILCESFYVLKGLLMDCFPFEWDIFLGEIGEYRRPFR